MSFATARVAPEKAVFRPALPLAPMPGMTEMQMATLTYREQLLHPNWQRKRLEIMQRDEFRCQLCYDDQRTLHVHHKQYAKGRMAWEYPNDELVTLCEQCHDTMHEQQGMLRDITAKLHVDGPGSVSSAIGLLAGWVTGVRGLDFGHVFDEQPSDFVCGEIAAALDQHLLMEDLVSLLEGLNNAPYWVVRKAMRDFVQTCRERKNEPPPANLTSMERDL